MILKITYHDVVRRKYWLCIGILGKRAASLCLGKRASGSDKSFFRFGSPNSFSEKLYVSGITLAFISHQTKFVFKLPHSPALFNGQPFAKAGQLPAAPLCCSGRLANGQTLSAKTGHSRFNWSSVTEAGYLTEENNSKVTMTNKICFSFALARPIGKL